MSYASMILGTPGLASYWRLNETVGPMVDQVGGRQSTSITGFTRGVPGAIVGDADRAVMGDPAGLGNILIPDLGLGLITDFTTEGWVWNPRVNDDNNVFLYSNASGSNGGNRIINRRTGAYAGIFLSGVEWVISPSGLSVVSQQWSHWMLTRSGARMTLYRNGVQIGQRVDLPAAAGSSFTAIRLGVDSLGGAGMIDEFAVYTRELTAADAAERNLAGRETPETRRLARMATILEREDGPPRTFRLAAGQGGSVSDRLGRNVSLGAEARGRDLVTRDRTLAAKMADRKSVV